MRNMGVRAEHMSSTFSVYQKVRIHMSILSGIWESIVSTSLLKRFSNRPEGVLSKKACGACKTLWSMLRCMRLAASSILWVRHNRQLTNNSTPVRRGEGVSCWWPMKWQASLSLQPYLPLKCVFLTQKTSQVLFINSYFCRRCCFLFFVCTAPAHYNHILVKIFFFK